VLVIWEKVYHREYKVKSTQKRKKEKKKENIKKSERNI
jgi:hypothetical protein